MAVLDLGLPDGDGADLIAVLRRGNPGVRVLIVSASLDPASIEKARAQAPTRLWTSSLP